jgi:glutathione synthase
VDLLFVMDPLEGVAPDKDTTYSLMRAASRRGHRVWHATAADLHQLCEPEASKRKEERHSLALGGSIHVHARPVEVPGTEGPFRWLAQPSSRPAESFQVIWLRTDPPFDEAYLEATWLLDRVDRSRTLLVNDPTGVRGANEKLYALRFPELCPLSLVTRDPALLRRFVEEHGEVVLKPLSGHAGEGILFAQRGMRGLGALLEVAVSKGRCEAQVYLPEAAQGDKRILLLDGEPLGAVLRLHAPGEERNNLHLGGKALPSALDAADLRIVEAIAPTLRRDGLYFVGIDVIGGRLTEVNVTSPTGIQEIESLGGEGASERVIDWCEGRAPRGS